MIIEIPKIKWKRIDDGVYVSTNTFIEYAIIKTDGFYHCNYAGGKFKEFKTKDEAKEWVQSTHYPAQIKKYFKVY